MVDNKQRVYRVLQCQENELTHVSIFVSACLLLLTWNLMFNCVVFRWYHKCRMDGGLSNSLILVLNTIMDRKVNCDKLLYQIGMFANS